MSTRIYQYGYCMVCQGPTRRHQLTVLGWQCETCQEHQQGEPNAVPKPPRDWSAIVAWCIIGVTAAYVLARMPW